MKLTGRYFIEGHIVAITGLHIGGSKASLDIGGVDSPVIKTVDGVPYVPGSSLKGKFRSLLAWEAGSMNLLDDDQYDHMIALFGQANSKEGAGSKKPGIGRLKVRDAKLSVADEWDEDEVLEVKVENMIDRIKGSAKFPRQIERVTAGQSFKLQMVVDEFDNEGTSFLKHLKRAMEHLQDSYLGGGGSRGYGQIQFSNIRVSRKKVDKMVYEDDKSFDQTWF